eukprot:10571383-Ditylum_brightwellii.AAC.1
MPKDADLLRLSRHHAQRASPHHQRSASHPPADLVFSRTGTIVGITYHGKMQIHTQKTEETLGP